LRGKGQYSLFDKIAFFLNHYLKLGIPSTQVMFRHIWKDKKTGAQASVRQHGELGVVGAALAEQGLLR